MCATWDPMQTCTIRMIQCHTALWITASKDTSTCYMTLDPLGQFSNFERFEFNFLHSCPKHRKFPPFYLFKLKSIKGKMNYVLIKHYSVEYSKKSAKQKFHKIQYNDIHNSMNQGFLKNSELNSIEANCRR